MFVVSEHLDANGFSLALGGTQMLLLLRSTEVRLEVSFLGRVKAR